jgi:F0F1-type ATP synthase assembly protein I
MSPFEPSPGRKQGREYAQIGLLATVPWILLAAPVVGFFAGQWADKKFSTAPWLMIAGIVLGFVAAAREIWNLVRKSEAIEKENEKNKEL